MSKKVSIKHEDLIEMLLDDRIIETLFERLLDRFAERLDTLYAEKTDKFMATLESSVEHLAKKYVEKLYRPLNAELRTLKEESSGLKTRLDTLESNRKDELVDLRTSMNSLETSHKEEGGRLTTRLNMLENSQRQDCLLIRGLPELSYSEVASHIDTTSSDTDLTSGASDPNRPTHGDRSYSSGSHTTTVKAVLNLCRDRLGITLNDQDITAAYRITRGRKDNHRPIIVTFRTRRIREMVYQARRELRDKDHSSDNAIYINEYLTKINADIYAHARAMVKDKKLAGTWTRGGLVMFKRTDSEHEKPSRALSIADLKEHVTNTPGDALAI